MKEQFPVLIQGAYSGWQKEHYADCPTSIAWALIEPHRAQAVKNHDQTLERLAQRGGLSPTEIYAVMHDLDWGKCWPLQGTWLRYEADHSRPHPDRTKAKEFVKALVVAKAHNEMSLGIAV